MPLSMSVSRTLVPTAMPLATENSISGTAAVSASADRSPTAAHEAADKLVEAGTSKGARTDAIESTDVASEADRKYEKPMEEDYVKREGGA